MSHGIYASRRNAFQPLLRFLRDTDWWMITAYWLQGVGIAIVLGQVWLLNEDPSDYLAALLIAFEGVHIALCLMIIGAILTLLRKTRGLSPWRSLACALGAIAACSSISTTAWGAYNTVHNMQHLARQFEAAASLHDPAAIARARARVLAYVRERAGDPNRRIDALRLMVDEANPFAENGVFGWIHYARSADGYRLAPYRI